MAATNTIDKRPHTMGNLHMVTGSFTNSGSEVANTVDLTGVLVDIVACGATAGSSTAGSGSGVDGVFASINTSGPKIVINCVAGQDGTWWAMGHRS